VFLAGCATHEWAPGPDAKGTFEEANARCSLVARHSGSGFYAQGSARFVAGAALGAAVGDAVRANADFNDCMAATGWVVADKGSQGGTHTQAEKDQVSALRAQLNTCIDAIRRNPKYAAILPHLLDNASGHYSLTQMSDSHTPTVEEASLLASYGDEADTCRDQLMAEVSAIDPRAQAALQHVRTKIRDLDLALIHRQLTWGDYARHAQAALDNPVRSSGAGVAVADSSDPTDSSAPPDGNANALMRYDSWQRDGGSEK
jgi:hypothetical protein